VSAVSVAKIVAQMEAEGVELPEGITPEDATKQAVLILESLGLIEAVTVDGVTGYQATAAGLMLAIMDGLI
jgi:hypothetical protein